jgi:hypothetical protein
MLVSEAIQYLNTFTFTSSSLNDDERIDALLKSLNLAHYEIYKRYWHIPDFETMVQIFWDDINTQTFSINRDGILKLKSVYSDTLLNIEQNLFNSRYLHDKKNDFIMHAGKTYLSSKPFLQTYTNEEDLETQRYVCTIVIIPEPKKLVLEDENDIETSIIPYQDVFFDALLAKALLYHHSTLDGTNPKFREWQQAYNEKIRYLDGYYTSSKK